MLCLQRLIQHRPHHLPWPDQYPGSWLILPTVRSVLMLQFSYRTVFWRYSFSFIFAFPAEKLAIIPILLKFHLMLFLALPMICCQCKSCQIPSFSHFCHTIREKCFELSFVYFLHNWPLLALKKKNYIGHIRGIMLIKWK